MIKVTNIKGKEFYLNCDKIEKIEVTPDTTVSLTSGTKYVVRETPEQLLSAIKAYKSSLALALPNVFSDNDYQ